MEGEQLSDLDTQLNQLTFPSNQQLDHADVCNRKEATGVKSSRVHKHLQDLVKIQVDKQRDGEYRENLSAKARSNEERMNYFRPDSRFRNRDAMDLQDDYPRYKRKEELSADAWIDQLSVHGSVYYLYTYSLSL